MTTTPEQVIQTIRDIGSTPEGVDKILAWLTKEFFVTLTSSNPNVTPEDRDRAWRELEKNGYEPDPERPFSLRKKSVKSNVPITALARVFLQGETLVAVRSSTHSIRYCLYDNADGSRVEVQPETANTLTLMTIAQSGATK